MKLVYIVLGVVGVFLSTRVFDEHYFLRDFYIYYTNLTNYLCLVVMTISFAKDYKLVLAEQKNNFSGSFPKIKNTQTLNKTANNCDLQTARLDVNNNKRKHNSFDNCIFVSAILIFITFLVYNMWLADFSLRNYFLCMYNMLFHVILPIWFIIFAFTECTSVSLFAPLYAFLCQAVYVLIVFIRSLIIKNIPGRVVYPYFFLNFETLGILGSLKWLGFMLILTATTGYTLILIFKLIQKLKVKKINKNSHCT